MRPRPRSNRDGETSQAEAGQRNGNEESGSSAHIQTAHVQPACIRPAHVRLAGGQSSNEQRNQDAFAFHHDSSAGDNKASPLALLAPHIAGCLLDVGAGDAGFSGQRGNDGSGEDPRCMRHPSCHPLGWLPRFSWRRPSGGSRLSSSRTWVCCREGLLLQDRYRRTTRHTDQCRESITQKATRNDESAIRQGQSPILTAQYRQPNTDGPTRTSLEGRGAPRSDAEC